MWPGHLKRLPYELNHIVRSAAMIRPGSIGGLLAGHVDGVAGEAIRFSHGIGPDVVAGVIGPGPGRRDGSIAGMSRFRVLTPLRWSDMDAYGHINNVQFLRLLEEARVMALSDGLPTGADLASTGLYVARSEIEYLAPLLYRPAPVAVDIWVTRIGAADFDMAYEVLDATMAGGGPGTVFAHAETTLVAFDLQNERPRRISAEEKKRLESWRADPIRWKRRRGMANP